MRPGRFASLYGDARLGVGLEIRTISHPAPLGFHETVRNKRESVLHGIRTMMPLTAIAGALLGWTVLVPSLLVVARLRRAAFADRVGTVGRKAGAPAPWPRSTCGQRSERPLATAVHRRRELSRVSNRSR